MSQRELDDANGVPSQESYDAEVRAVIDDGRREELDALLEEKRLRFVQQILSHDSGVLSVEELSYRNPEVESRTVDYHLRQLETVGLVERRKVTDGANELPDTYWAVTETGVTRLDELGFYDEVEVLAVADEALERTDRIERIEAFDGRPQVDVSPRGKTV